MSPHNIIVSEVRQGLPDIALPGFKPRRATKMHIKGKASANSLLDLGRGFHTVTTIKTDASNITNFSSGVRNVGDKAGVKFTISVRRRKDDSGLTDIYVMFREDALATRED